MLEKEVDRGIPKIDRKNLREIGRYKRLPGLLEKYDIVTWELFSAWRAVWIILVGLVVFLAMIFAILMLVNKESI